MRGVRNWSRSSAASGVVCVAPGGSLLGGVRIPEPVANVGLRAPHVRILDHADRDGRPSGRSILSAVRVYWTVPAFRKPSRR